MSLTKLQLDFAGCKGVRTMKLPLISASVVAYTLLGAAWICQADLLF
jgi:hypothetical protein